MTWPVCIALAIIIVCLAFMLILRKELKALVNRTKSVKYGSGEIQTINPSQEPVDTTTSSTEECMREFDSPVLLEQENLINEALKKVSRDKEKFLVRSLAISKIALTCEQLLSIIWGSQVSILEYLNERRTLGATKQYIKTTFYDVAIARWPLINPYEGYLDFMKASHLINETNESLFITNFGVEFLQYLTNTGKSNARFKAG